MRMCPKCTLKVADGSKICRVCGSILDEVEPADPQEPTTVDDEVPDRAPLDAQTYEPSQPADDQDDQTKAQGIESHSWQCVTCGEKIERNFDVCWNCGTARDGTEDPEFVKLLDVTGAEPDLHDLAEAGEPAAPCAKCGSERIIPHVPLVGNFEHSTRLKAVVIGNPDALILRDPLFGEVYANICGQCGHMELRVENSEELYEHYLKARD
jgi:hypothetical protein